MAGFVPWRNFYDGRGMIFMVFREDLEVGKQINQWYRADFAVSLAFVFVSSFVPSFEE